MSRKLDEYQPLPFYKKNTTPKQGGFSKFDVDGEYFFCRYVDGKVAMISQAYSGAAGRDNGIASVKKNEKSEGRYKFEDRDGGKFGFSLLAGNGQEIAVSPNYGRTADAQHVAGRLTGKIKGKPRKTAAKSAVKTAAPKAAASSAKSRKTDGRIENYKPLKFYQQNTPKTKIDFDSFSDGDAHYFTYAQDGEIVLISESYTSEKGRDNGIASVKKNMKLAERYEHHTHKNGKHYFDINAANHQEIATSIWYDTGKAAKDGAKRLRGELPLKSAAVATAAVAGAAVATKRKANVEQNYHPLAFYQRHTEGRENGIETFKGDDGEYYFAHFEDGKIALISEGYPTTAARDVGVASVEKNITDESKYVYRGPLKNGKFDYSLRAGNNKEIARSVWYGSAAAAAAAAGAAYLIGTRRRVPPVKPAPIAPVPVAAAPVKAAAPIAAVAGAAALGAAGLAAAANRPDPVAAAPMAAAPIAAAAATSGGGIWGWLKWLLLGLLALLGLFFLFKTCAKPAVKAPVVVAKTAPVAAPLVACWDGSEAKDTLSCPTKVTCWDGTFAASQRACPVKVVAKDVSCWDGSMVEKELDCPVKPAVKAKPVKAVAVAGSLTSRTCGYSNDILFNVGSATPRPVGYLGSNPQFGDSLSLTPDGFYRKLKSRFDTNMNDHAFLNLMARSLGYSGFNAMDASMFSNDTLANDSVGLLGYGAQHALQYSKLSVDDVTNLEAFRVRAANGTDVHFMKRCGNYMYVCNP